MAESKDFIISIPIHLSSKEYPIEREKERLFKAFENELQSLGLTGQLINQQGKTELQESLRKIDEILKFPRKLKILENNSEVYEIDSLQSFTIDFHSPLLDVKKNILARLNELNSTLELELVTEFTSSSNGAGKKALNELRVIRQEKDNNYKEIIEVELKKERLLFEMKMEELRMKIEMMKSKSRIRLQFLQRESMASMIGAILLLIIITMMIFREEIPTTLNNAFLVILGYFFGQSVVRTIKEEKN